MPDATAPDPVTAYLAEVEKLEQGATRGPWQAPGNRVETVWVEPPERAMAGYTVPIAHLHMTVGSYRPEERNAKFIAMSRTAVPRLLAAVRAGLALTKDGDGDDLYPSCDLTVGDLRAAITRELLGEDGQ